MHFCAEFNKMPLDIRSHFAMWTTAHTNIFTTKILLGLLLFIYWELLTVIESCHSYNFTNNCNWILFIFSSLVKMITLALCWDRSYLITIAVLVYCCGGVVSVILFLSFVMLKILWADDNWWKSIITLLQYLRTTTTN